MAWSFAGLHVLTGRLTSSAVLLAILLVGAGAQGQTGSREVLLGVSRVGTVAPAGNAQDAARLYEAARDLLRNGETTAGQRQLERLVAGFPDSEAAFRARRDLAAIYAAMQAPATQQAVGPVSYLGAPIEASPKPATAISGGWRTTIRPASGFARTAQEDLRNTAGDLVFFSEGSAELGARARKALAAQAVWLVQERDRPVVIEGHADDPGTASAAMALSGARATAVRARLIEEGVAPERIRIVAYGASRRVAICSDESCASQNRRAVTVVGDTAAAQLTPR